MKILHTESSRGWGGQEMRILNEAIGMQERGHEIILAINKNGKLAEKARKQGFLVYELSFAKHCALSTIFRLLTLCKRHQIDIVNTHSSLDAWIGGIAARLARRPIIRTRHLSTAITKGINSYLLYNKLVDFVVTTSSAILPIIAEQARLDDKYLQCIPTGLDLNQVVADPLDIARFRASLNFQPEDIVVGTACFVRSWKGIDTFLKAAQLLKNRKRIKWVIVGGGHLDDYRPKLKTLDLQESVTFTGHLENPFPAMAAMDIFALLSTAHEGISQASLQAAFLQRPLITTAIGGLPEVCIDAKTGIIVPAFSHEQTAEAVVRLADNPSLRKTLGTQARAWVEKRFTKQRMLDDMENIYQKL